MNMKKGLLLLAFIGILFVSVNVAEGATTSVAIINETGQNIYMIEYAYGETGSTWYRMDKLTYPSIPGQTKTLTDLSMSNTNILRIRCEVGPTAALAKTGEIQYVTIDSTLNINYVRYNGGFGATPVVPGDESGGTGKSGGGGGCNSGIGLTGLALITLAGALGSRRKK